MIQKKLKSRQTELRIHFSFNRLWIGILLATISVILCKIGGASLTATVILPVAFLFIAVVEMRCSPLLADILIMMWGIVALFATVFSSQLLLNESTFSLGLQRILLNMAICGIVMALYM